MGLGDLGSLIAAPLGGEFAEPMSDLLAGGRQSGGFDAGLCVRDGEVGSLPEPPRSGRELFLNPLERLHEMWIGVESAERLRSALGACPALLKRQLDDRDLLEALLVLRGPHRLRDATPQFGRTAR